MNNNALMPIPMVIMENYKGLEKFHLHQLVKIIPVQNKPVYTMRCRKVDCRHVIRLKLSGIIHNENH